MGRSWHDGFAEARAAFAEASEAVGTDLARLCFEGPEAELQLTENTQPALLVVSTAIARVLAARGAAPAAVAGHSLGEYSAHVAAGTLELGAAARLVRLRGRLMQEAVPVGVGAMAAILGLAPEAVAEVAAEAAAERGEVCSVANYNAPEQTVIAGHAGAVARAGALAKARGAKRALPLPVSAPFHCALMRPAREALAPALAAARFGDPACPVVVDIDARAVRDGDAARDALVRQVDGPVRWVECVRALVAGHGVTRIVEVGSGNVLCGLVRRIAPEVETIAAGEPEALAQLGI
jgi:[acyl-carrier-protein] S-malonyltransferase